MLSLLRESSCANGHAGWLHTNCFVNGRRHQILRSGVASNMVSVPPVTSHSSNYLIVSLLLAGFFFFLNLSLLRHCVVWHGQGQGHLSVRSTGHALWEVAAVRFYSCLNSWALSTHFPPGSFFLLWPSLSHSTASVPRLCHVWQRDGGSGQNPERNRLLQKWVESPPCSVQQFLYWENVHL